MPREGLLAVHTDLEPWQMRATCEDQLLQQSSVTSKMNVICEYISAKISKFSNVLTRGAARIGISVRHAQ
jgi:hypothetical protein